LFFLEPNSWRHSNRRLDNSDILQWKHHQFISIIWFIHSHWQFQSKLCNFQQYQLFPFQQGTPSYLHNIRDIQWSHIFWIRNLTHFPFRTIRPITIISFVLYQRRCHRILKLQPRWDKVRDCHKSEFRCKHSDYHRNPWDFQPHRELNRWVHAVHVLWWGVD